MNMNSFYRRVLDFEEVVKHRVGQAIIESGTNVDKDVMATMIEKAGAEVKLVYLDMVQSLQALEARERESEPKPKKSTRKRK